MNRYSAIEAAGNRKAAADPPEYPFEWDRDQRVGAYWAALRQHAQLRQTSSWYAIANQAARRHERIRAIIDSQEQMEVLG